MTIYAAPGAEGAKSGLNVIQALGFSVPVIASSGDRQSGPEIEAVRHRQTGLLFDTGDSRGMEAAIRQAYSMVSTERRAMGEKGRSLVKEHYTAEKQAGAMAEAMLRVLGLRVKVGGGNQLRRAVFWVTRKYEVRGR